jgi:hypothetical protein
MTEAQPPDPSTRDQHYQIARKLADLGHAGRAARLAELSRRAGRDIPVFAALTRAEADTIIQGLSVSQAARAHDATLASLRADGWAL